MNQKDLKKQIKSGKLSNLYVFCGDDYFLKQLYLERIAKAFGLEVEKTKAEDEEALKEANVRALSNALFGSKRRLVYCSVDFKLKKGIALREPKDSVFIVDALECDPNLTNAVVFEKPTVKEIQEFLLFKAHSEKKTIDPKALDFLTELFVDKDTTFINNTFNVILLYCSNKDVIDEEDVKQSAFESSKFYTKDLFKFLNRGDTKGILNRTDEILKQMHPTLFIHLLSDSFIKIYMACCCDETCFSSLFKGYYGSFYRLCERFGKERVKMILKDLYNLDRMVKSAGLDGVEALIKAKMVQWVA